MARTNSYVMAAFRKEAGITNQAIKKRRDKLLKQVIGPADIASYAAAHQAGVRIERFLDADTLRRVGEYEALLAGAGAAATQAAATPGPRAKSAKTKATSELKLPNLTVPPDTVSAAALKEADRMGSAVYRLLYVFENSVREFVNGHLTDAYGKDWWDRPHLVKKGIREAVAVTKKAEGENRWVERKTAHEIYYTMLGHLSDIMVSNDGWKVFQPIFKRKSWVEDRVASVEVPRNVVAHMNPLKANSVKGIEVRAQEWFDQIKDHLPPE